jgi:hypothetical protein
MTTDLEVHYACDSNGDHTANMAACTESKIKKFDTLEDQLKFIAECTYVYDLDKALGNKVKSKVSANPVLDCIEDTCFE